MNGMLGPYELADVEAILPHRAPFLFVDRVVGLVPSHSILAERLLRGEEPHFAGHFPGRAVFPGVLVAEALAQASGLLLGLSARVAPGGGAACGEMYYLGSINLKFLSPAVPGEILQLRSEHDGAFGGLCRFRVGAGVGRRRVAEGTLTLARVS